MPWDQTENYIRSGHRKPEDFDPETLKTITLSQEEGIKAITAEPWNSQTTDVVSYLFSKENGWTTEKVEDWFSSHPQYVQAKEPPQPEPASPKPLGEAIIASSEPLPSDLIHKKEILNVLPEDWIVRAWSIGPQLLVRQLKHKLTSQSTKDDRE